MKKKVLSALLVAAMTASMFAGCGSSTPEATQGAAEPTSAAEDKIDYGTGEITIWVAENVHAFTQGKVDEFFAANPDMAGYTVTIQDVGEGDAGGNMLTDVEAGADIYTFPQDNLARLVAGGALMPVGGDYATFVTETNVAGAVEGASLGGQLYAFPITADNTYFMYYDKSVITDASKLETILADCSAAGKTFNMNMEGWYGVTWFFGTGCELTYDTDAEGNFLSCNCTYDSAQGVAALKGAINLHKSGAWVKDSTVSNATNAAVVVSGTWDKDAAMAMFGDNFACAKLPTFNVDGTDYQMAGFNGYKLFGVKPQTEEGKALVCLELAKFLSNEDTQVARFQAVGWGPSNINAGQSAEVLADPVIAAVAAQAPNTICQGQYPGDYWGLATGLGDDVFAGKYDSASDEDLMKVLADFKATCEGYCGQ